MIFQLAEILAAHGEVMQEILGAQSMLARDISQEAGASILQIDHVVTQRGQRIANHGQSVKRSVDAVRYHMSSDDECRCASTTLRSRL
jgi:hypothetical protein